MCMYFYQNHIYNTVQVGNLLIVIIVSCSVFYLKQKTTGYHVMILLTTAKKGIQYSNTAKVHMHLI